VESALVSISSGDYYRYKELFTEKGQEQLPKANFQQVQLSIIGKIGTYVDKTFVEVKDEGGHKVVYYQAQFTDEPSSVTVRAVFQEENSKMKLVGFWLDSPKLHN
jgi:hypothetical protein